jgi:hypothetical protein
VSAALSPSFDDACDYEEEAEQAADLALTIRARRIMLDGTLSHIDFDPRRDRHAVR